MKNYYDILGIPENTNQHSIKSAFRRLAFKHHPDRNPGNEKQAESRFKEINEAYAVLGDKNKRQQYDYARKNQFTGAGYSSFQYSQQDIFQGIFANQTFVNELNRMFSQAGLRFDRDFMNQVFSSGGGSVFHFYGKPINRSGISHQYPTGVSSGKQNWFDRMVSRAINRFNRFMLKKLLRIDYKPDLDLHTELVLTPAEIYAGVEKEITYKRGKRRKKLIVRIPPSAKKGTKIRLKGMGMVENKKAGDLYLHIKVIKHAPLHPT